MLLTFPLFLPCFMREQAKLSTTGQEALRSLFFWYLLAVCGASTASFACLTKKDLHC